MHCSMSENSNEGRISFLTRLSILPLEIWPSLQCHSFDESRVRFLFFCALFDKETFPFTSHTEKTFSCKDNKYSLSCKVATPTQIYINHMAYLPHHTHSYLCPHGIHISNLRVMKAFSLFYVPFFWEHAIIDNRGVKLLRQGCGGESGGATNLIVCAPVPTSLYILRCHRGPPTLTWLGAPDQGANRGDEVWKIKPYPRKGDEFCLSHITELTVKSSKVAAECTKYHDVPAVIFSLTGYTGNLFHDFTDVMVPLFTTASQFNGEVQFLITDMALWWTIKYHTVLEKLSNYPVIDFSKDDQVHCFKHAIVGLHAYMEFTIDSSKAPHGVTMVDFNRFMRGAYSLGKGTAVMLGENPKVKPRLLIIKRHRTRMFLNLDEIIAMAEGLGFEVVIDEANVSSDISGFAKLVNSVDVMMGVHGAGLTNCVFLPQNATLIQIVPWGGLDWISRTDFGNPSEMMGLRYKQYAIGVDESSLTEQYPRDHDIFKNPISFHKRGFEFIRHTFMDNQNVRLDCKRFRPILLEALDNLNP
uniref:Uncharacterized protein n=1 Tax=Avena sativa TaxID=4498 RepID=A0ACD5TH92_AVESA